MAALRRVPDWDCLAVRAALRSREDAPCVVRLFGELPRRPTQPGIGGHLQIIDPRLSGAVVQRNRKLNRRRSLGQGLELALEARPFTRTVAEQSVHVPDALALCIVAVDRDPEPVPRTSALLHAPQPVPSRHSHWPASVGVAQRLDRALGGEMQATLARMGTVLNHVMSTMSPHGLPLPLAPFEPAVRQQVH